VQVNLDNLLTGLGNGELLQPNSVLGVTVWQSEQYLLLWTELQHSKQENASLRNELCVLKHHPQANAHQHQLQPPPPQTLQHTHSLFHQDYVSQLAQACTSHATELAHLQAQLASSQGSLRAQHEAHKAQHASWQESLRAQHEAHKALSDQHQAEAARRADLEVELQAQHEAHKAALSDQHLAQAARHSILGLQHRQAEAALRAALEDRHTRQQQEARRDLINEIKENALHFVHGAPTYKALYSTGLARVDSSGNVMPGEQWHGCDGAHAQEADVDSPNSSLRDEDPFWLHQRVRKALHEQWTGFMQRCYAITGWDQHTTNHFSGAGGKAASIIAKMLRYNGPDGLAVPHGSIGFGSLLTAVLTSMPAHVMLLEESHKKTKSSLVAMLRKVVGPCAELDESLNGASQRKRRRERK
jgi:hypothetical protein